MITGDHERTACAIARELGILTTGKVITGKELDKLTKEEYLKVVEALISALENMSENVTVA